MQYFCSQSALLKYWEFEPVMAKAKEEDASTANSGKAPKDNLKSARSVEMPSEPKVPAPRLGATETVQSEENEDVPPKKLIPVILFDEAHRLPLLIRDKKAMKCILDALLVLTKQVCYASRNMLCVSF